MKVITKILDFEPEYDLRSICPLEEMLLFDIETTGLKKETTQLYLIGCVYYRGGEWCARQWLTENASDEIDVLSDFLEFAKEFTTLVNFNGEGFDIPYIRYKAEYYGFDDDFSKMDSFDIYKHAKRSRQLLGLKSMSQKSLEEYLGIFRDDRLNGGLLIPVYYDFERNNSPELEKLLLLHNFDDIQGMLKILPVLTYSDCLEGGFDFSGIEEFNDTVILEFNLRRSVPVYCECTNVCKERNDIQICLDKKLLQINIKITTETGRLPLENVEDYYYLPEEDRVIHKAVAEFVDKSRRKKATKKNCFLKKEGRFIPQLNHNISPAFLIEGDRKRSYVEAEKLLKCDDPSEIMTLAAGILQAVLCS